MWFKWYFLDICIFRLLIMEWCENTFLSFTKLSRWLRVLDSLCFFFIQSSTDRVLFLLCSRFFSSSLLSWLGCLPSKELSINRYMSLWWPKTSYISSGCLFNNRPSRCLLLILHVVFKIKLIWAVRRRCWNPGCRLGSPVLSNFRFEEFFI